MRFSLKDLKMPAGMAAAWLRVQQSRAGQYWARQPWLHRWPTRRQWWRLLAALPLLLMLYVLLLIPLTPSIRDIRKAKQELPAQILSADGQEIALFKRSNRQWVALADIAPSVVQALVATEDHRFYEHHGMDWRRTLSSVVLTLRGNPQGGSTITQQLARNLYPTEIGRAPNLNRKLKEAITAFKIEALYTKPEILETYLNTVPFLYNAWGIEMAARTYFDKTAARLTVLESATLVGMLKGTSYYNPVLNPERALARRNTVLAQMRKRGQLDDKQYAALSARPLRIDFERQEEPSGMAPHFAQQLRKWLISWADRNGYSVYADGLVVHTTLDARMQSWANQAVARQGRVLQEVANRGWSQRDGWNASNPLLSSLVRESGAWKARTKRGESDEAAVQALLADKSFMQQLRQEKTRVQAGFLAMDPRNGHVLAWVGSRDFALDAFDHVQQARRQPGSTFKPFVYGAALQQGVQPDDKRTDQPVHISLPGGEVWSPSDARPATGQSMTLRDALAYSKNTITADLMQEVGPARVARLARALGVRQSPLEAVPALALGSSPVTLLEMVNAYSSLARNGAWLAPLLVTRIENREGQVLAEFAPAAPEQAMEATHSYALVDMMRSVVDKGTASAIRSRYGIRADVAGKTGTTQGNADGWFILMHPQLVAGAWAGFNDGRISLRNDHWGQGSRSALPMVGEFTARALRSPLVDSKAGFVAPDNQGWWSRLAEGLREHMQAWWQPEAKPDTAAKPAASTSPAPAPQPPAGSGAPEAPDQAAGRVTVVPSTGLPMPEEIVESTPALPAASAPPQGAAPPQISPDIATP